MTAINNKDEDKKTLIILCSEHIRGQLLKDRRASLDKSHSRTEGAGLKATREITIITTLTENGELPSLVAEYVSKLPEASITALSKKQKINGSSGYEKLADDILRGIEGARKLEEEKTPDEQDYTKADKAGVENFVAVGNAKKYVQRNFDYINSDITAVLKDKHKELSLPKEIAAQKDNRLMVLGMGLGDTGIDKELFKGMNDTAKKQFKSTAAHIAAGMIAGLVADKNSGFTLGNGSNVVSNISGDVLTAIVDMAVELAQQDKYKGLKPNGLLIAGMELGKVAYKDLYQAQMDKQPEALPVLLRTIHMDMELEKQPKFTPKLQAATLTTTTPTR